MRLAILSDIHGNLAAFEAVLTDLQRRPVDQIIIAGDIVVGSPDSAACWQLACSLRCPIVRGNHERYVAHYGTAQAPAVWATPRFAPVQWAVAQCSPAERATIDALPLFWRTPELPDLLIVHASLRSDNDSVAAYTPAAELAQMFPQLAEHWVIRGHNHLAQVREWNGRRIITTGAVGLPLDGNPAAQYLVLERHRSGWRYEHRVQPYDVAATVRRFHETGYLAAAGPISRLFLREVITAGHALVPFFRTYQRWSPDGSLPLAEAVERFLYDAT
ncbi:MAG: metallophosphoesterase family protein [Kouleothrix sp.]